MIQTSSHYLFSTTPFITEKEKKSQVKTKINISNITCCSTPNQSIKDIKFKDVKNTQTQSEINLEIKTYNHLIV